jgi:peptidyl-dipeptidase A
MNNPLNPILLLSSLLLMTACSQQEQTAAVVNASLVEEAQSFLQQTEVELDELFNRAALINWDYYTNITDEKEARVAEVDAEVTRKLVELANATKLYQAAEVSVDERRMLDMLSRGITIPAPSTEGAAERLAEINTGLTSIYSKGTIEFEGETVPQDQTELLMRNLDDPAKLEEVWSKWREATKGMRDSYAEMVAIANEGARELGFEDTGHMWRSGYDMDADAFVAETDRLWGQVKPLYDELHCYVRAELNEKYGDDVVPLDQPIRADILGNMWAQSWDSLFEDVKPDTLNASTTIDLDALLLAGDYTEIGMVETGENFFSSLGFDPLPQTFWERSLIVKPEDRDVVCHASAWNLDNKEDIRIKMCTNIDAADFSTIHHELGHSYYQRAYKDQPLIFREGANDGFHEAIGDFVALSITPEYLQQIGLLDEVPGADGDLELLMQRALAKIGFLPFGLLMDKWRWQVFSGELTPETYNQGWWDLREEYQGIRPPSERPDDAFDPGSKYHIPSNVPYMRYFLSHVLQFQFYQTACDVIGWEGPLHRCSFYGSEEVGEKLNAMLELGSSQPWQDTLELFTGSREIDASAVVNYFQPLMSYLEAENSNRQCGW